MVVQRDEIIEKEEALKQINLALRRAALIYHCFCETLVGELGEAQGTEMIKKAVEAYGTCVGQAARQKAIEKGLALTPENFESDIPDIAWETEEVTVEGEERRRIHFCPLAKAFIDLGDKAQYKYHVSADIPPRHREGLWRVFLQEVSVEDMKGLSPFFGTSKGSFFRRN